MKGQLLYASPVLRKGPRLEEGSSLFKVTVRWGTGLGPCTTLLLPLPRVSPELSLRQASPSGQRGILGRRGPS